MLSSVWRIMLVLWLTSVLLLISLPWSKYDATPHWNKIQLAPFRDFNLHPSVLIEAALNVVAFIPVGYLAIRSLSSSYQPRVLLAMALGGGSSLGIEFYQVFCQDRVPSLTDVFMNAGGTGIGVWLAFAIDRMCTFVWQARH